MVTGAGFGKGAEKRGHPWTAVEYNLIEPLYKESGNMNRLSPTSSYIPQELKYVCIELSMLPNSCSRNSDSCMDEDQLSIITDKYGRTCVHTGWTATELLAETRGMHLVSFMLRERGQPKGTAAHAGGAAGSGTPSGIRVCLD